MTRQDLVRAARRAWVTDHSQHIDDAAAGIVDLVATACVIAIRQSPHGREIQAIEKLMEWDDAKCA
jgi:hypothetical protein